MKTLIKPLMAAFATVLLLSACETKTNRSEEAKADSIDSVADATSDSLKNQADTVDSAAEARIDTLKKND